MTSWRKEPKSTELADLIGRLVATEHQTIMANEYDEDPMRSTWESLCQAVIDTYATNRALNQSVKFLEEILDSMADDHGELSEPKHRAAYAFVADLRGEDPIHYACHCDMYEFTMQAGTIGGCKLAPENRSPQCAECMGCKACRLEWEGEMPEKQPESREEITEAPS